MKKILTISAVVLFVVVLGLAYYYFFFAKKAPTAIQTQNTPGNTNPFPFGEGGTTATGNQNATSTSADQTTISQPQNYLQKLRLISGEPVSGATFIESAKGVTIRYMEKATGHIYDVSTYSSDDVRVSNTTIPRIYETLFTDAGQGFIARYIGDDGATIESAYGKIVPIGSAGASATTSPISGTLLATNINFMAVSPSGKNTFYIQKTNAGSTGIISASNGTSKKQIWISKIGSVLPQFATDNQILLTTAPNVNAYGYAYLVNAQTGSVKNILGNIPDLSTLINSTADTVVLWGGGVFSQYSVKSGATSQITPATFPEKCVFDSNSKNILYCAVPTDSLSASSLDNWYLGLVSYSDDIWKYDLTANTSRMIENLSSDAGRAIDAIDLHINSASSLLLFQSKSDGSLWSLNVSGN